MGQPKTCGEAKLSGGLWDKKNTLKHGHRYDLPRQQWFLL
jgi:hypothetical protein